MCQRQGKAVVESKCSVLFNWKNDGTRQQYEYTDCRTDLGVKKNLDFSFRYVELKILYLCR